MNQSAILEALLFVAGEPLPCVEIARLMDTSTEVASQLLEEHQQRLADTGAGLVLKQVSGGWRLYTHEDARPYLERFAASDRAARLSGAALETLAVVAYQQPVSRGQVSEIRGVDSERALRTLQRRELIAEVGQMPGPGQAVLFGTTDLFLEQLGINDLSHLPPLADHVPPSSVVDALERPFRPESTSSESTN